MMLYFAFPSFSPFVSESDLSLWYLTLLSALSGMSVVRGGRHFSSPNGPSIFRVYRWTPFGSFNKAMQTPSMQMKLTSKKEERRCGEDV